ncbi:MAG: insulinase family protein, partial [Chlamydiales bacterium]
MIAKSPHLSSAGQTYHQFTVTKAVEIPELQCFLRELVHEPTGAHIMHLGNEDPENLFCLSFQTLPYNSNGVAHILEHTVLCGSDKFPVKDPFFSMSRRSLNTFMNALTGSDFTCYPAASQVPNDFYNLLDVYLDAVFHPQLKELSFLQEGHRLEFAVPSDPSSPLERKGIVYNEMKGALSSASARLSEAIHQTLFPDVMYGVNSGGDPKEITKLTYQELKDFHQKFYHPSRCLFFFYGNMPLETHLDFISEHALSKVQKAEPLPLIPLQPRFKKPVYRELFYPIARDEEDAEKSQIAFTWLTCHILEQQEALALSILEIILLDTDASPLKMALMKTGLCKQVTAFIDVEIHEIPCGVVLKGCRPEHADTLESVLMNTLKSISEQGIPILSVENAIHQLEFHGSEITGDHAPFGLSLFMRSGLLKQHGVAPELGLTMHSLFERIHQLALEDPFFFSHLIRKYFLNNTHFTRIVMQPDKTLGDNEANEERQLLDQLKSSLSEQRIQEIVNQAKELATFQKQQENGDIDVLPKVSLSDVPLNTKNYPMKEEQAGKLKLFHHQVFTNDIIYADFILDLPDLPEEDLPYLRFLTTVLTQMGCNDRNYAENLEYIQAHTGGIGAGISLNLQAHDHNIFSPAFHLRGKALHRKASKLFALIQETLTSAHLKDLHRLKVIFVKHFTAIESRLNQSALKYAINLSASALNIPSKIANDLYGLNYFWKLKEIVNHFDKEGPILLAKLLELQEKVLHLNKPHLIISCDGKTYDELKTHRFYGLEDLEAAPFQPWKGNYSVAEVKSQGRLIASPVAFIGKVFPTVSYTHPDAPALNIAAFLFDNLTLHKRIREQGGAYGGGSVNNALSGNFYFYSYRDPNIASTLKAFEEAVQHIMQGKFTDADLVEAKLEMIQSWDTPISPGSQAEVAYGWMREGRTPDLRQAFRNATMALKKEEIIKTVGSQILTNMGKGATVVFAGKDLLEKTNRTFKGSGQPT